MDKKNHTEPAKTGFDAISGAARALYPGQEGVYYGTLIPYTQMCIRDRDNIARNPYESAS